MERHHPKEPHWYLAFVGCDPTCQGQGLGSALIKEGLRRCDADGLPAYLESSSPRNIPLRTPRLRGHGRDQAGRLSGRLSDVPAGEGSSG
jgi:GNAT superfamily N-acetyltransferase